MCFAHLPGFLSSYKDVGEQCEAAACIEFFFADLTWSCVLCSMTPTGVNPHYLLRGIMRRFDVMYVFMLILFILLCALILDASSLRLKAYASNCYVSCFVLFVSFFILHCLSCQQSNGVEQP